MMKVNLYVYVLLGDEFDNFSCSIGLSNDGSSSPVLYVL